MRLKNSHRRYCFAGCPGMFIYWISVHDSVIDFSHQLIHSWSSAIRNLRPARQPQLGGFGTISQVPQSEILIKNIYTLFDRKRLHLPVTLLFRPHKVYIFLISMIRRVDLAMSVCPSVSTQTSFSV